MRLTDLMRNDALSMIRTPSIMYTTKDRFPLGIYVKSLSSGSMGMLSVIVNAETTPPQTELPRALVASIGLFRTISLTFFYDNLTLRGT